MRRDCADLTEVIVFSGHWMAQERPIEVNAALAKWLAVKAPNTWPTSRYARVSLNRVRVEYDPRAER